MRRGEQEYKSAIVEKESNSVEESIYLGNDRFQFFNKFGYGSVTVYIV